MVTLKKKLVSINELISFYNSLPFEFLEILFPDIFRNEKEEASFHMKMKAEKHNNSILWNMITKSVMLQKTKLKIENFISVDENGNLIKDQNNPDLFFTGFKTEISENKIFFKIHNDDQKYWITYLKDEGRFLRFDIIEDLVPLGIGITENYLNKNTI